MVLDAGCKSQWVPMSLMGLGIVQQIMQARLAEGKRLQQIFANFTISAAASPHGFLQRLKSAAGYSHLCSSGKMASRHAVNLPLRTKTYKRGCMWLQVVTRYSVLALLQDCQRLLGLMSPIWPRAEALN